MLTIDLKSRVEGLRGWSWQITQVRAKLSNRVAHQGSSPKSAKHAKDKVPKVESPYGEVIRLYPLRREYSSKWSTKNLVHKKAHSIKDEVHKGRSQCSSEHG